jgi:hypothetical protein
MTGRNDYGDQTLFSINMVSRVLTITHESFPRQIMIERYGLVIPDYDDETHLITEAQLRKCREILGHVSLPFITP